MIKPGLYTINELRAVIRENNTNNEFKPKLGDGVESENKKNNKEAVEDITGRTGKYNGKKMEHTVIMPNDRNKTTIDLIFNETKPGEEWFDRVEAQAEGYPSVDNKKTTDTKDNGSLEYKGNEEFYKHRKDLEKNWKEAKKDDMDAGLKGRELKKYNDSYVSDKVNENKETNSIKKNMKRLHYKKTTFLTESQMLNMIPEEYKTDGNKFYVKDASGTEYLVECTVDKRFDFPTLTVVSRLNEEKTNSELDRMKQLFGYDSSDYFTKVDKKSENLESLHESLEKMKKLSEDK
jgi:hypothetical protein